MPILLNGVKYRSHYDYLDENLPTFFQEVGLNWDHHRGIIGAHGDKCSQYRYEWEEVGIPFNHGVAIYLLTYCHPFSQESRETEAGWVAPKDWVIENYDRFKEYLAPSD